MQGLFRALEALDTLCSDPRWDVRKQLRIASGALPQRAAIREIQQIIEPHLQCASIVHFI